MFGRFAQAFLAERHRADFSGETQLAEGDEGGGNRRIPQTRPRGHHDGQVSGSLRQAHAADHIGEHILARQLQSRVAMRHGQQHREAVGVDADRHPPRIGA